VAWINSPSGETLLGLKRCCNMGVKGHSTRVVGEGEFASKKGIIIATDIICERGKVGVEQRRQKSECNHP
jgi:hypothetical protein